MIKMLWWKIRFCFGIGADQGKQTDVVRNSKEETNSVNEEYKEAFRTKSYTEICSKVQNQFESRRVQDQSSSSSSSPPSPAAPTHLPEFLVEPREETLTTIFESSNLHEFLVDYFAISLDAGRTCESLLQNINQVRINHRSIDKLLKLIKRSSWSNLQYRKAYGHLAAFAVRKNPLSRMTRGKFHELHDSHELLLHQLTSQCKKTKRRTRLIRWLRRALAAFLVFGCTALGIALLLLSIQTLVGMVAAPGGLIVCSLALIIIGKLNRVEQGASKTYLKGQGVQLDIAAKGAYILINDFDTISRLVERLHDETEHRQFAADMCVMKGKNEMLKGVVGEFEQHESRFVELVEELEKQIYLCLVDINRSRRLLVEQMSSTRVE